jgi:hypothetical protein
VRHALAHRVNHASAFHTQARWHVLLVQAHAVVHVNVVQAHHLMLDTHLAGRGFAHLNLGPKHFFWATVLIDANGVTANTHGLLLVFMLFA